MGKMKIILPDGSVLTSGATGEPAIMEATLTRQVNDSQELSLGSVCAGKLLLEVLDPEDSLGLAHGDTLQAFRQQENGELLPLGLFILEEPVRTGAHMLRLTAYDRVTLLDKDLTQWLASLEGWPYTLREFAEMAARACGLDLDAENMLNADYRVQAFSAWNITGRKLLQWAGQIAGRFCRATPEGNLEFAWYTPLDITLTPDGSRYYFGGELSYETYQVAPVEKVQLKLTQDDLGVVWPDETGEKNTYIISGNYLLTNTQSAPLQQVAQTLYGFLKDITYTPCRVKLPETADIQPGHILRIRDGKGYTFATWVMEKTLSGQVATLVCTGSPRRDSTAAVNHEDYGVLNSRLLELRKEAEGVQLRLTETKTQLQAVEESVSGIQVGGRNLIRNSMTLIYADYCFASQISRGILGESILGNFVLGGVS